LGFGPSGSRQITLVEMELLSGDDESIIHILKNDSYAAIFTEDNIDDNNGTIILANGMTMDELNKEKTNTIEKAASARRLPMKPLAPVTRIFKAGLVEPQHFDCYNQISSFNHFLIVSRCKIRT
jgi:hypothetical protein